jgi:hypothetical protein
MPSGETHVVVFDVNVYLDVADLLGEPFDWTRFGEAATATAGTQLPAPDQRVDALRAIALCMSGRFAGLESLEVWTSSHIDELVVLKASQPDDRNLEPEQRGLGWGADSADALLEELVYDLVFDKTGGGTLGDGVLSRDSPPLSHEDGIVFSTACEAGDGPGLVRYCVTSDNGMRQARPLSCDVLILYPHEWVDLVRRSRSTYALGELRP